MNRNPLNGAAINGRSTTSEVRGAVIAKAYARVRASGRVLVYEPVNVLAKASVGASTLGRVLAYEPVAVSAQAQLSGTLGRTLVRAPVAVEALATVAVRMPAVGGQVRSTPRAKIDHEPRVELRAPVKLVVRAKVTAVPRLMRRGPVASTGQAKIGVRVTVIPLMYVRRPVKLVARALLQTLPRVYARLSVQTQGQALVHTTARVLVRSPVHCMASALAVVDTSIFKRLPFDEPAPDSRVFYVPAGTTTFYVTR